MSRVYTSINSSKGMFYPIIAVKICFLSYMCCFSTLRKNISFVNYCNQKTDKNIREKPGVGGGVRALSNSVF
jgi:hypothetical protein